MHSKLIFVNFKYKIINIYIDIVEYILQFKIVKVKIKNYGIIILIIKRIILIISMANVFKIQSTVSWQIRTDLWMKNIVSIIVRFFLRLSYY